MTTPHPLIPISDALGGLRAIDISPRIIDEISNSLELDISDIEDLIFHINSARNECDNPKNSSIRKGNLNRTAVKSFLRDTIKEAKKGGGKLYYACLSKLKDINGLSPTSCSEIKRIMNTIEQGESSTFTSPRVEEGMYSPPAGDITVTTKLTLEQVIALTDIFANFYPQGPIQSVIWQYAGGKLAILDSSSTGRDQWFRALCKVNEGIAGISINSLLRCALDDYPNNQKLIQIRKTITA